MSIALDHITPLMGFNLFPPARKGTRDELFKYMVENSDLVLDLNFYPGETLPYTFLFRSVSYAPQKYYNS